MRSFFWLILLFVGNECLSQKKDTIAVVLDFKKRIELAKNDLTRKYNYTKTVQDRENNLWNGNDSKCKFITAYNLNELNVKIIPEYELLKEFKFQGNVLNFINFNPSERTTVYSVNDKNNEFVYFEFDTELWDDSDSVFLFDCVVTTPLGSNILTMMKLRLQDKYVAFRLKNLSQVLFIVDEGIVYAISKPRLDGTYQKTEINEFFAKEIGFGGVEFITDSDEEQEMKNYKFTPCDKIFKEEYYFNPKILH